MDDTTRILFINGNEIPIKSKHDSKMILDIATEFGEHKLSVCLVTYFPNGEIEFKTYDPKTGGYIVEIA